MELQENIFITGIGITSAIGNNAQECLSSLRNSKTGIEAIKYLDTIHKNEFPVGEVKLSNNELYEALNINRNKQTKYTRTSLLGIMAVREALQNASVKSLDLNNTALVSSTTVGGMDNTERYLPLKESSIGEHITTHPCGDSSNKICDYTGIKGYRTTISTACSSGANAIIHGIRLIKNGIADIVVAGGVDSLSKFTLNGFNSLMILDKDRCQPFDKDRKGLNLGEGAGYVVLESEFSCNKRGVKPICQLKGFANTNDAYHQTASSPEGKGATLAMEEALHKAGLIPEQIDYINAHGTGTENNDQSEGVAIINIFGKKIPSFSSTKQYTGHTLGAAAGIEAVISVMSIKEQLIFNQLNFKNPIKELQLTPISGRVIRQEVNSVLSNSFGFGGNNSTLIFTKV